MADGHSPITPIEKCAKQVISPFLLFIFFPHCTTKGKCSHLGQGNDFSALMVCFTEDGNVAGDGISGVELHPDVKAHITNRRMKLITEDPE